jgi:hypothetical protein
MAEKHLLKAIGARYAKMSAKKRTETIRKLSPRGARFIRKFFPRFYAEAFPETTRPIDGFPESATRRARSEKRR